MKLNPQQEKFFDHYLVHGNATKATIAAGYNPKTASQKGYLLLRSPKIKAMLAERRKKVEKKSDIDAAKVLTELWKVYEGCEKDSDRLRALELMGKHIGVGAFVEKVEHGGKDGAAIPVTIVNLILARISEEKRITAKVVDDRKLLG